MKRDPPLQKVPLRGNKSGDPSHLNAGMAVP
jgi:hypothetical protein